MTALLAWFERFQRRHSAVAFPLATSKRFGEHRGATLAATISYYAFFSVFPLMLAFVTILGIVLDDNPDLRDDLVEGALGQIPVIGSQIADVQQPLTGSTLVLVFGIATAVWAGSAAVTALQVALDEIWDVPEHTRPNTLVKRLRSLGFLVVLGLGIAASTLFATLTSLVDFGPLTGAIGFLGSAAVNVLLLLGMFLVLPTVRRPLRGLLVGAVPGGIILAVLLQFGRIVFKALEGASDTYGTFAVVIGLLGWFHLVSRVVLMSAMLNDVVVNHLWPRSVTTAAEPMDADRKAALLDMHRIRRDPRFGFALSIGDDEIGTERTPASVDHLDDEEDGDEGDLATAAVSRPR